MATALHSLQKHSGLHKGKNASGIINVKRFSIRLKVSFIRHNSLMFQSRLAADSSSFWYRRISRRNKSGDILPLSWWQHKLVKLTKKSLEYIEVWTSSFPTATREIFFLLLIRNHELIIYNLYAVYDKSTMQLFIRQWSLEHQLNVMFLNLSLLKRNKVNMSVICPTLNKSLMLFWNDKLPFIFCTQSNAPWRRNVFC